MLDLAFTGTLTQSLTSHHVIIDKQISYFSLLVLASNLTVVYVIHCANVNTVVLIVCISNIELNTLASYRTGTGTLEQNEAKDKQIIFTESATQKEQCMCFSQTHIEFFQATKYIRT